MQRVEVVPFYVSVCRDVGIQCRGVYRINVVWYAMGMYVLVNEWVD